MSTPQQQTDKVSRKLIPGAFGVGRAFREELARQGLLDPSEDKADVPVSDVPVFRSFMNELLDNRSMMNIQFLVEEFLSIAIPEEGEVLIRIQNTNDLDQVWLICHEYLGNQDKVQELQAWLAKKASRK